MQTVPLVGQLDEDCLNKFLHGPSNAAKSMRRKVSGGNINSSAIIFQRGSWDINVVMWESGISLVVLLEIAWKQVVRHTGCPCAISNRVKKYQQRKSHHNRLNNWGDQTTAMLLCLSVNASKCLRCTVSGDRLLCSQITLYTPRRVKKDVCHSLPFILDAICSVASLTITSSAILIERCLCKYKHDDQFALIPNFLLFLRFSNSWCARSL